MATYVHVVVNKAFTGTCSYNKLVNKTLSFCVIIDITYYVTWIGNVIVWVN